METILGYFYIFLKVVVLFGASIFVHEYGHYWVARRRGMVVEEFAIGFGPVIFSWMVDGVRWSLRWIPAGGFVKLPQMMTSEAIEGKSTRSFKPASPLTRILVAVAGPAMNVVFAFLVATVIWQVGLPTPVNPSIIGYVDPDSPEARLGIREGDRITAMEGKPVRSWHDILQATALARTNLLSVEIERDGKRTVYSLQALPAGPLNYKMLNLDPRDHPSIAEVQGGSAAEAAGLQQWDEFVSFAGVPVVGQKQLIELIQKRPEQATEVELIRKGQRLKLVVTPRKDSTTGMGRIGTVLTHSQVDVYELQRPGPTPWENISTVLATIRDTFGALIHYKQTGVGIGDLSGPIGIGSKLATDVKVDLRRAFNFLVLLNINLAIINLLPLPVLDGGHITMAIIEWITRRRVSVRIQEILTAGFATVLISFMLYVTFNDIKRFRLFKAMFQQESVVKDASGR